MRNPPVIGYHWTEEPEHLGPTLRADEVGVYLEALSGTIDGALAPRDVVDRLTTDYRSSRVLDADTEEGRLLQACEMVLCLGVEERASPEWLRRAREEAQKTRGRLESGAGAT